ncbi:MAG TPA: DUF87 domain-containing protein [Anaerolineales bacterium]|nr:DUF87 domain-containing protein [Anaerolineales bacterium]
MNKDYIAPWVRVIILLSSTLVMSGLSYLFTGSIIPRDPQDALIFQNALLLIVIGVALLEKYYTKPADSMVNSLMGVLTLLGVYDIAPKLFWWVMFSYLTLVFFFAIMTTAIYSFEVQNPKFIKLAELCYQPAVVLGQARVLYSVVFLYAIFTFKGVQSLQTVALVLFWGIFIVIWPLRLPQLMSRLSFQKKRYQPVGHVMRTDWPNIVRVTIQPSTNWTNESIKIFQQVDGKQSLILPLFSEPQGDELVGTGLVVKEYKDKLKGLADGFMYDADQSASVADAEISEALGGGSTSKLVGFIVEKSTISEVKFEIWDPKVCWEGLLVWSEIGGKRVYYQITSGSTEEEVFQSNRHGFQLGTATQLGMMDGEKGFLKHNWVPRMNSPVFAESESFGTDIDISQEKDFVYGTLPGTKLKVAGPFLKNMDHHTAILGVTGSGKTELAFDLIRHAVDQGLKVLSIDLTARYEARLGDLTPKNLSLTAETVAELNKKLFDVETGSYGAGNEKRALEGFAKKIREDVQNTIQEFMTTVDDDNRVGIITLEEISNSKATLFITEMYLTCLLNYAKDNFGTAQRVLIAVDEAHTIMPEPSAMGLGDYDSRGLVGKIAQIALQGRKYGVGLLVIAQRTATVSKSILTQCNTVISFNCFDDTSLNFLSNVYGRSYVPIIPNLPQLHAIVFGKGIRSQRPLIIQIPFDPEKAEEIP